MTRLAALYRDYCIQQRTHCCRRIYRALGLSDDRILLVAVNVDHHLVDFLARCIRSTAIEELAINNTNADDVTLSPLIHALVHHAGESTSLHSLELLDNQLADDTFRAIANLLSSYPLLQRLKLGGNRRMSLDVATVLSDAIAIHPSLIQLHVSRLDADDAVAAVLMRGAMRRASAASQGDINGAVGRFFETLSFCATAAGARTCDAFVEEALAHCSVPRGEVPTADDGPSPHQRLVLERLKLRHCDLGSLPIVTSCSPSAATSPIARVARALRLCCIRRLDLDECKIAPGDVPLLAAGVRACPAIDALSVSGNPIGTAGLRQLLAALDGRIVRDVSAAQCDLSGSLADALVPTDSLTVRLLNVSRNGALSLCGHGMAAAVAGLRVHVLVVAGCAAPAATVELFASDVAAAAADTRLELACVDLTGVCMLSIEQAARVAAALTAAHVRSVKLGRCGVNDEPARRAVVALLARRYPMALGWAQSAWTKGELTLPHSRGCVACPPSGMAEWSSLHETPSPAWSTGCPTDPGARSALRSACVSACASTNRWSQDSSWEGADATLRRTANPSPTPREWPRHVQKVNTYPYQTNQPPTGRDGGRRSPLPALHDATLVTWHRTQAAQVDARLDHRHAWARNTDSASHDARSPSVSLPSARNSSSPEGEQCDMTSQLRPGLCRYDMVTPTMLRVCNEFYGSADVRSSSCSPHAPTSYTQQELAKSNGPSQPRTAWKSVDRHVDPVASSAIRLSAGITEIVEAFRSNGFLDAADAHARWGDALVEDCDRWCAVGPHLRTAMQSGL